MTRREYHVPNLDSVGNGYLTLPGVKYEKIVSVVFHGSYPPSDGYWPVPRFGAQQRGNDTILEIYGGQPNQKPFDVVVWVAD